MAYLPYDQLDPTKQLQQQGQLTQSAPAPSGGGSSAGQTSVAPSTPDTGSGWVNLQDYLAPNASGAQAMGQQYAGSLTKQANDAAKTMQDYADQDLAYQKAVVQGTPTTQPDQYNANAAESATNSAFKSAGTQDGAQAYLAGQYGKDGNYTQGMKGLDAWLLGQEGMGPVNDAQKAWKTAETNALPTAYQQIVASPATTNGIPRHLPGATPPPPPEPPPHVEPPDDHGWYTGPGWNDPSKPPSSTPTSSTTSAPWPGWQSALNPTSATAAAWASWLNSAAGSAPAPGYYWSKEMGRWVKDKEAGGGGGGGSTGGGGGSGGGGGGD